MWNPLLLKYAPTFFGYIILVSAIVSSYQKSWFGESWKQDIDEQVVHLSHRTVEWSFDRKTPDVLGFNVTMRNFSCVLGPLAWSLRSVSSKICVKATKFFWPFSSQPLLATRACQKAFLFCFLILILVEHVQFIISVWLH